MDHNCYEKKILKGCSNELGLGRIVFKMMVLSGFPRLINSHYIYKRNLFLDFNNIILPESCKLVRPGPGFPDGFGPITVRSVREADWNELRTKRCNKGLVSWVSLRSISIRPSSGHRFN